MRSEAEKWMKGWSEGGDKEDERWMRVEVWMTQTLDGKDERIRKRRRRKRKSKLSGVSSSSLSFLFYSLFVFYNF